MSHPSYNALVRHLIIVNPVAGRGRVGKMLNVIEQAARKALGSRALELVLTKTQRHAVALAAAAPEGSRVVAVGGDGTVHEVLGGLVGSNKTLGVVPIGSGNDFARMLNLLAPVKEAMHTALNAAAKLVDLPMVNAHPYAASLGMGFDAAVAKRSLTVPRFLTGMPRYLYALILELGGLHLPRLRLESMGELLYEGPALLAAIMNGPTYAGGMRIAPMADPHDGYLSAVVLGRFSRAGALGILPRVMLGRHMNHPEVYHFSAPALTARFDRPVPAHTDGELIEISDTYQVELHKGGMYVASRETP